MFDARRHVSEFRVRLFSLAIILLREEKTPATTTTTTTTKYHHHRALPPSHPCFVDIPKRLSLKETFEALQWAKYKSRCYKKSHSIESKHSADVVT